MRHLPLLALLVLPACATYRQPISKEPAENNKDYTVEYLFEHDGCKVYRFQDGSYYVYYTNCKGDAVARTDSTAVSNSTHVTGRMN